MITTDVRRDTLLACRAPKPSNHGFTLDRASNPRTLFSVMRAGQVWRIHAVESFAFSTKERVPCLVRTPPEISPNQSATLTGVRDLDRGPARVECILPLSTFPPR